MSASFLASKLVDQTVVELHSLTTASLNGKRGRVVAYNPSSGRVGVSLTMIENTARGALASVQCKWVLPERCLVVSNYNDCTSRGIQLASCIGDAHAPANPAHTCQLDCLIADQSFSERVDEERNPGWWKLPLELFIRHLFASVMRHLRLAAPSMDVLRSQMGCARLRLDGRQIDWDSTLEVSAGEILSPSAGHHRIEVHLDHVVPRAPGLLSPLPASAKNGASSDISGAPASSSVCVAAIDGGKGFGVLLDGAACRPGDVLLSECPLVRLPFRYSLGALRRRIGALPPERADAFFSLSCTRAKFGRLKDGYGVWQTNALPLSSGVASMVTGGPSSSATPDDELGAPGSSSRHAGPSSSTGGGGDGGGGDGGGGDGGGGDGGGSDGGGGDGGAESGVFEIFSRINHSCKPCCRCVWDEATGRLSLVAMDAMPVGAELTISYGATFSADPRVSVEEGTLASRRERRRKIRERFGFWCACAWCQEEPKEEGDEDDHNGDDNDDSLEEGGDEESEEEEESDSEEEESDSEEKRDDPLTTNDG